MSVQIQLRHRLFLAYFEQQLCPDDGLWVSPDAGGTSRMTADGRIDAGTAMERMRLPYGIVQHARFGAACMCANRYAGPRREPGGRRREGGAEVTRHEEEEGVGGLCRARRGPRRGRRGVQRGRARAVVGEQRAALVVLAREDSLILGRLLLEEGLVDVRDDATARDRRLDEGVELLVTTDGELEVAGRDALHPQVLRRVARELEHLSREVLKDGSRVDGGGRAHTPLVGHAELEVAVDPADGELKAGLRRARDRLLRLELGSITLDLGRHV